MRVHSFRRSGNRVTATVEWEDSARGPFDLFFESSSPDLPRDGGGEAFVLACLPIAVHHQERRLRVDAPICPFLQDRLEVLLGWWRQWHMLRAPIVIEVNQGETPLPSGDRQAYSFISGGFDSLHLLLRNRERYPLHHPRRIKRSIFGHGFDLAYRPGVPDKRFAMVLPHLQAVADDAGVELIIAESNLIMMDNDGGVWVHYLHGAGVGRHSARRDPRQSVRDYRLHLRYSESEALRHAPKHGPLLFQRADIVFAVGRNGHPTGQGTGIGPLATSAGSPDRVHGLPA
jgi:hypothetical protein